jgi:hypothetical protein
MNNKSIGQARMPLIISRNNIPGRMVFSCFFELYLKSTLIIIPEGAFLNIGQGEFPVFLPDRLCVPEIAFAVRFLTDGGKI